MSDLTERGGAADAHEIVRLAVDATREWRRRAEGFKGVDLISPGDLKHQAWLDVMDVAGRLIKSGEWIGEARARLEPAVAAGSADGIPEILGRVQRQLLQAFERLLKIREADDVPARAELRAAVKLSREEAAALLQGWKAAARACVPESKLGELAGLQLRLSDRLSHCGGQPADEPLMMIACQFGSAGAAAPAVRCPGSGWFARRKRNRRQAERGRILLKPLAALQHWLAGQLVP